MPKDKSRAKADQEASSHWGMSGWSCGTKRDEVLERAEEAELKDLKQKINQLKKDL